MFPLDPSYTKNPNSSYIIPCKWGEKLPYHTLHNGAFMSKRKLRKKKPSTNRLWMGSEWIICIRFSKKKNPGEDTPPPPPPMRKEKLFPYHVRYIGTLKAKNTHNFGRKKSTCNRHKWAKNAPFASVFQKFSRGDPDPPPLLQEDKKLPFWLDMILYSLGENSPTSYRRSELWRQKLHTNLGKKQQTIGRNGLRMHHLHPFFKNFLRETQTPPPPTARG